MTTITITNEAVSQLPQALSTEQQAILQELKQEHKEIVDGTLEMLEKFIRCGGRFKELMKLSVWGSKMDAREELCKATGIGQTQSYTYEKAFEQQDILREKITLALADGKSVDIAKALSGEKSSSDKVTQTKAEKEQLEAEQRVGALFTANTDGDVTRVFERLKEAVTTGVLENPITGEKVDLETAPKSVIRKTAMAIQAHDRQQANHEHKMLAVDKDSEYMTSIPNKQLDHLLLTASFAPVDKITDYNSAYKGYKIPNEG